MNLDDKIIEKCVSLRKGRSVKIPDAIIAATAMLYAFMLVTTDKAFENIMGLKVLFRSEM